MMAQRKRRDWLKDRVRDPSWEFIGVIVGIIIYLLPGIISLFAGDAATGLTDSSKLMIYPTTRQVFLNFPESLGLRTQLFINEHEEHDVRLYTYFVEYRGQGPLRKEAFEKPIVGEVSPDRKLIVVKPAVDTTGPVRLAKESGNIEEANEALLTRVKIKRLSEEKFEIEPAMMNPGEWFKIEIYTAARVAANQKSKTSTNANPEHKATPKTAPTEITWSCHVEGVRCPMSYEREAMPSEKLGLLQVKVNHQGWAIYFIVLFTVLSTIMFLILARLGRTAPPHFTKELFIVSLAIIYSLSTGEILADWIFNGKNIGEQPLISSIQLALYALFFILLALPAVLGKNNPKPINVQTK